jgi:hypothetical protein
LAQKPGPQVFLLWRSPVTARYTSSCDEMPQKPDRQFFFFDKAYPSCFAQIMVSAPIRSATPKGAALDFKGAASLRHWFPALADWLRLFPSCGTCVFSEPGMRVPADFSNTM